MIDLSKMYLAAINDSLTNVSEDMYGLQVANHQFLSSFLRFSVLAGCHVFVSDAQVAKVKGLFKKVYGKEKNFRKIKVFAFSAIRECAQKYRYCVFHHGDPLNSNYFYVRQQLGLGNFPISCFVHTVSCNWTASTFVQTILANTKPYDVMFCPTRSLATAVQKLFDRTREITQIPDTFRGELCTVPFGVDTDLFKPRSKKSVRKKLKLPQNALIIGYIGRVTAWNKMDLVPLLEVFRGVLQRTGRTDVYLYIIGREQQKDYLKLLRTEAEKLGVSARVRFVSKHKNKDIPAYYSACDLFVSPCDHVQETFGITPVEAMSSGLPVVVSDWDGYKETVRDGETGYRIPTYWHPCASYVDETSFLEGIHKTYMQLGQSVAVDVPRYTDALVTLICDDALREQMGRNARAYALENYSWEKIIRSYEEVWSVRYEQAQQDTVQDKKDSFYVVPYFRLFEHYPTNVLSLRAVVQCTERGRALCKPASQVSIYKELKGFLFADEIKAIAKSTDVPMHVTDLLGTLQRIFDGLTEDELMRHVLWMLKFGYLELKAA